MDDFIGFVTVLVLASIIVTALVTLGTLVLLAIPVVLLGLLACVIAAYPWEDPDAEPEREDDPDDGGV